MFSLKRGGFSVAAFFAILLAAAGAEAAPARSDDPTGKNWLEFRRDGQHTGSNAQQTTITRSNVASLKPKWVATTYGVFANAVVSDGTVYQADLGGAIYAWDLATGAQRWEYTTATPANGDSFQSTPQLYRGTLYIGDYGLPGIPANFRAIDASTGHLKWRYAETDYQYASFQGSPLVSGGLVYIGESTSQEGPGTCDPRHQVVGFDLNGPRIATALNLQVNGADVWSTPTLDDNGNMFVATGNACSSKRQPGDKYSNAVLRLERGRPSLGVAWTFQPAKSPPHEDYDFGATPVYVRGRIIEGGKDGYVYAVDAGTGALIWSQYVGEVVGSPATDGTRVYVPVNNLVPTCAIGSVCGSLTALNVADGTIAWSLPAHEDYHYEANLTAPAVSGGVVYAAFDSTVWAFNAATGATLWQYPTGHLVYAGISLVAGGLLIGNFDTGNYYCFTPGGR